MKLQNPCIALLCIFSAFSLNIFGQSDTFDISNYKLPEIHRRQLDFNMDLSGSPERRQREDSLNSIWSYSSFHGSGSVGYNSYTNTARLQSNTHTGLSFIGAADNRKDNSVYGHNSKYKYFSPHFYFNTVRRYYRPNKNFIGTNIMVNYDYYYNYDESDQSSNNYKTKDNSFSAILPIIYGKGRIEPVQDIRQALYIVDELVKEGRLKKDISRNVIEQFAHLVSRLKNERYFDYRLQRMHELEALDSFLVSNKLVTDYDARYFSVLSDYWDYGSPFARYSGNRISFAVYPAYTYSKRVSELYNTNDTYQDLYLYGNFEFIHEKPVNLYVQNSIRTYAYGGKILAVGNNNPVKESFLYSKPDLTAGVSQKISYYPNTRTNISFDYSLSWGMAFKENINDYVQRKANQGINLSTGIIANYYFSPQLRLQFDAGLSYRWQENSGQGYYPINISYYENFRDLTNEYGPLMSSDTKNIVMGNLSLSFIYKLF